MKRDETHTLPPPSPKPRAASPAQEQVATATPTVKPLEFFSENVDRWGAAEWFDRLAKAIREQDKAVVAKDEIGFDTYRMIAASSAMALVRDHEQEVRSALVTADDRSALLARIAELEAREAEAAKVIERLTPGHRAPGCWCSYGRDIDRAGHEIGCDAASAFIAALAGAQS